MRRNAMGRSSVRTVPSPKGCCTPANTPAKSNGVLPSRCETSNTITADRIAHAKGDRLPLTVGVASMPHTSRPQTLHSIVLANLRCVLRTDEAPQVPLVSAKLQDNGFQLGEDVGERVAPL